MPIAGAFVVPAGRRRAVDFALPLPWETPVTIFGGVPLMSLRMGLRTEASVDVDLEQGAMVPIFVHPLPTQQHILAALDALGFSLRQAGLVAARLPGVEQALPLHQRLGWWVAPLYAGPITELEVIFVANSAGLEVILWADRRLSWPGSPTRASAGSGSGTPARTGPTGSPWWTAGCDTRSTGTPRRRRTVIGRPGSASRRT